MRVLVTGANGHLGNNLCRILAEHRHSVRASVRSLSDAGKTARLRELRSVECVECDVYRPEQLRAAMDGIEVVFHAAAVYAYVVDRGQENEVIRASVEGATNALRAAADAKVRKVVLTSSIVTVPLTKPGAPPSTEADWTQDLRIPYMRAKTVAERTAWKLAKELGLELVTILPGAIAGPGFTRNTPSIDVLEVILRGGMRMGAPNTNYPYVDVRDVVSAHVLAAEQDCTGRFIVCNDHLPSFMELIAAMRSIDPKIARPIAILPTFMFGALPFFDQLNHKLTGTPRSLSPEFAATIRGKIWNASNARIKRELGWRQTISFETSLRDTMAVLRRQRSDTAAAPAA